MLRFFGSKRKIASISATTVPGEIPYLQNAVSATATQTRIANFLAAKTLDNAGWIHSEIVAQHTGDISQVYGLDVLRAAHDVAQGYITDFDPPIAPYVSTIEDATSLAIAVATWISAEAGTANIDLLHSETFVQDTLIPNYWQLP